MIKEFFMGLGLFLAGAVAVTSYPTADGHTKTAFVLTEGITGRFITDEYRELINTLKTAEKGDEVVIILKDNRGGRISTMLDILDAMAKTKATVYTRSIGYAHSCALDILFFGDVVLLPYGQQNLAHMTANYRDSNDYLIPLLKYFKIYMTDKQYQRFINDEDVWVSTTDVCKRVGKPSKLKGHCVIRNRRLSND